MKTVSIAAITALGLIMAAPSASAGGPIDAIIQFLRDLGNAARGVADQDQITGNFDAVKPAAPGGRVQIDNIAGKIEVTGGDQNEVRVTAELHGSAENVEFLVSGDTTAINAIYPRTSSGGENYVNLTIHVPIGSSVDVETVSASVMVSNVKGQTIDVETVSGNVRVTECIGSVSAKTVSGEIEITGAPAGVDADSISGRIVVQGLSEIIEADTVSGPIEVETGALAWGEFTDISSSIRFKGALREGASIRAHTIGGDVAFDFTEDVFGVYDLSTDAGKIDCDFGPKPVKTDTKPPGYELRFNHGNGKSVVAVDTDTGSITIKR